MLTPSQLPTIYIEGNLIDGSGGKWTVTGPGFYHVVESLPAARELAAMLNNAYMLGYADSTITKIGDINITCTPFIPQGIGPG